MFAGGLSGAAGWGGPIGAAWATTSLPSAAGGVLGAGSGSGHGFVWTAGTASARGWGAGTRGAAGKLPLAGGDAGSWAPEWRYTHRPAPRRKQIPPAVR